MAYKIKLENRAYLDIDDALDYYSKISLKVTKGFDKSLQNAYKTISKNPHFQKRYKDFRVLPLKKYPYILIYRIDEENQVLEVFAVFNTNQNPNKRP